MISLRHFWRRPSRLCIAAALALAPGTPGRAQEPGEGKGRRAELVELDRDPYPGTYEPLPSSPTLIEGATILDGRGGRIDGGAVLMSGGNVVAVGRDLMAPDGAVVVDGTGKWVTPGIIDVHSHLGNYPTPAVAAHSDGNEATAPVTAEVWAEHSVWPQDPGFARALAGGVTALQVLPGSANLIGGRSVTLKNVPARTVQGMKFPGAPYGLKMACGENPKRVYGAGKKTAPSTRMGNVAGYRKAWAEAVDYRREWERYREAYASGEDATPPKRNIQLDTLVGVLEGEILVHNHCYRADEMAVMIDLAKEFGYKVTSFDHTVEAYKVADLLARNGVCASMWADWGGFKMEAYDDIRENIALVHHAGACAIVHSDSRAGIQRLHQEAAKVVADAAKVGIEISRAEAWQWLSYNPARALGVADQTGSLESGKDADIVLWSGDPFSVYTVAEKVFVDGALVFDLHDPDRQPVSDFRLGLPGEGDPK